MVPWQKQHTEPFLRAFLSPDCRGAPEMCRPPQPHHSTHGSPENLPPPIRHDAAALYVRKHLTLIACCWKCIKSVPVGSRNQRPQMSAGTCSRRKAPRRGQGSEAHSEPEPGWRGNTLEGPEESTVFKTFYLWLKKLSTVGFKSSSSL